MAKDSNKNQWFDALSELQSNYWSAWSDNMAQGFGAGMTPGIGAGFGATGLCNGADATQIWSQAAQSWQEMLGADAADEVMDNVLSQGRAFLQMTEDVLKAGAESLGTDGVLDAWGQNWHQAMGAGDGLAALWGMPQDTLRRTMSAFSAIPGDAFTQYKHAGVNSLVEPLREQVEKVLSVPPLGYTRESQEEQQRIAKEMIDYQAAMQKYMAVLAAAGQDAIDRLQDKLADASEPGRGVDSLRGLYDLWVDASEEAYADAALGSDFQQAYGEMVNSMMRLKKHGQEAVEHQLGALGIPGRQELNTAHRTIHALRREVSELRGMVKDLASQVAKAPASRPAATKTAAKKPAKKTAPAVARSAASRKATASKSAVKKSSKKKSVRKKS